MNCIFIINNIMIVLIVNITIITIITIIIVGPDEKIELPQNWMAFPPVVGDVGDRAPMSSPN